MPRIEVVSDSAKRIDCVLNPYLVMPFEETVFLMPGYELQIHGSGSADRMSGLEYMSGEELQREFGPDSYKNAWRGADEGHEYCSAAHLQTFLRALYHDSELVLAHVLVGVTVNDTGRFPYRIYGFERSRQQAG